MKPVVQDKTLLCYLCKSSTYGNTKKLPRDVLEIGNGTIAFVHSACKKKHSASKSIAIVSGCSPMPAEAWRSSHASDVQTNSDSVAKEFEATIANQSQFCTPEPVVANPLEYRQISSGTASSSSQIQKPPPSLFDLVFAIVVTVKVMVSKGILMYRFHEKFSEKVAHREN